MSSDLVVYLAGSIPPKMADTLLYLGISSYNPVTAWTIASEAAAGQIRTINDVAIDRSNLLVVGWDEVTHAETQKDISLACRMGIPAVAVCLLPPTPKMLEQFNAFVREVYSGDWCVCRLNELRWFYRLMKYVVDIRAGQLSRTKDCTMEVSSAYGLLLNEAVISRHSRIQ